MGLAPAFGPKQGGVAFAYPSRIIRVNSSGMLSMG